MLRSYIKAKNTLENPHARSIFFLALEKNHFSLPFSPAATLSERVKAYLGAGKTFRRACGAAITKNWIDRTHADRIVPGGGEPIKLMVQAVS